MLKKCSIGLLSLVAVVFVFKAFENFGPQKPKSQKADDNLVVHEKWKTFHKKAKREIASYPSTKKEMKRIKVNNNKRAKNPLKKFPIKDGRRLSGVNAFKYTADDIQIEYINNINKDWEYLAGENLLRFQPKETKLFIKKEGSLILLDNSRGQYAEEVTVTYLLPNGNQYSYNALVDSSNGNILKTWNRTRHEYFIRRPLRFSPN